MELPYSISGRIITNNEMAAGASPCPTVLQNDFEVIIVNIGEATKLRIIELCNENMITVNKLATISGITQSTISNIVGGRNNSATISTIKKLCDGLNISIRDFFASELFDNLEQKIK